MFWRNPRRGEGEGAGAQDQKNPVVVGRLTLKQELDLVQSVVAERVIRFSFVRVGKQETGWANSGHFRPSPHKSLTGQRKRTKRTISVLDQF